MGGGTGNHDGARAFDGCGRRWGRGCACCVGTRELPAELIDFAFQASAGCLGVGEASLFVRKPTLKIASTCVGRGDLCAKVVRVRGELRDARAGFRKVARKLRGFTARFGERGVACLDVLTSA